MSVSKKRRIDDLNRKIIKIVCTKCKKISKNEKISKIDKPAGGNKAVQVGNFQEIINLCSTFIRYS